MKRWRHFVVVIGIMPALVIYISFFMYIFDFITGYYWFLDWFIYLIAGLLWLYPAIKIISWLANYESK
ncbi:DUF2842 domain-containing protein [Alphaproteobacteria bacterium]|nr:DUF2842 domain-containing protein [Alphaproteobacteria bacterium]